MAVTAYVVPLAQPPSTTQAVLTWDAIANGEAGDAVEYSEFADRSVQFTGGFGGGTVVLQGSNDGTNWVTLTDPLGTPISTTSATLFQISQATRYIRPSLSGGAAGAVVTTVYCRRRLSGGSGVV